MMCIFLLSWDSNVLEGHGLLRLRFWVLIFFLIVPISKRFRFISILIYFNISNCYFPLIYCELINILQWKWTDQKGSLRKLYFEISRIEKRLGVSKWMNQINVWLLLRRLNSQYFWVPSVAVIEVRRILEY